MKLTFTTITAFSIIALLAGTVNATPAGRRSPQINPTTSVSQVKQLDLPLLVKASSAFFQSDRASTESEMMIKGGNQTAEFKAYAQIKTIVQSNKKFRAEIAFTRPGEQPKQKTLVISDGKQVSIYRPDLQQYAVTSYEAFNKSDDSFLIGLSSTFFLSIPEDTRQQIAKGAMLPNNFLPQIGFTDNQKLKADKSKVEGNALSVYNYTEPKTGNTFRAFVEPETATLKLLQLATKNDDLDVVVTEKILHRSFNPTITAQTFNFTPPANAKRVKSLSVSPF